MLLKTQDDIVKQDKGYEPQQEIRKILLPGIEQLHKKSIEEIAGCLANVLRMDTGITELRWIVGEYIELTLDRSAH